MRRGPFAVGLVVSLACLAGFWELAEDFAYSTGVARFDAAVGAWIQSWRSPGLTVVMKGFTFLGGTLFVAAVVVSILVVSAWGTRRPGRGALFVAMVVAGGMVLSTVSKGRFDRPRPPAGNALIPLPESYSFPSGHTMASLCLGAALGYVVLRSGLRGWWRTLALAGCALYPVLVGTSRVYLGVHWPSDVLASWLLGGAWLALVIGLAQATRVRPSAG